MSSKPSRKPHVERFLPSCIFLAGLSTVGTAQSSSPSVELLPAGESLLGDPISVRVVGLPPDEDVVLFSELVDRYGRLWLSESSFRSTEEGVVDPALQAPSSGAWEGIDALGPFWTPTRRTAVGAHAIPGEGHAERVSISAIVGERAVATASTLRWNRHPEVKELDVTAEGLVARMFVRGGEDPKPGVVVVPGSGGGIPSQTAELLASHGYASLALAYFGEPGLPSDLESVPLEYIDRALDWFMKHPRVDAERVALMGGSKGGELTLLMGSRRADLRALVGGVPSSVVFQSIGEDWQRTSSWSLGGEDLPFVPYVVPASYRETGRLSLLYEESLKSEELVQLAGIPIERAACPILMITGRDDWIWPATSMCDVLVARLEANDFQHEFRHLAYDDVGHEVLAPGYRPVSWSPRVGGTRAGHGKAQAEAWRATLDFLAKELKPD